MSHRTAPQSTHPTQQILADFQDSSWRTGAVRGVAIGVWAASIVVAPVALLRVVFGWPLAYVAPLAFLVALEGILSTGRLGRPEWRDRRGVTYRLGEVIVILLVTRLVVWAFSTGWPSPAALGVLLRHPGAFFDVQTGVVAGLLLAVWLLAVSVTADFLALAIQPDEVAARESRGWGLSRSGLLVFRPVSRGDIVARFSARWAWGGLPLVVFTGLSQLSISQDSRGILHFGLQGMGLGRDVLVGLLCYFLIGLLLLSDARLAVLRGRWYNERVAVAPHLLRRWHGFGSLMLLAVAAGALLLPLGPVGPLASALEWLIAMLARIGMFLGILLTFLWSVLLYPLHWLLSRGGNQAPPAVAPLSFSAPLDAGASTLLPDWLRGALVWIVVGLVACYLLFSFLRGQGVLRASWGEWMMTLRLWWRARRGRLDAVVLARVAALRKRLQRARPATTHDGRGIAVGRGGALPPRARVRYFYLTAVQRAAERGHARPPHVTPAEYARELEAAWPEAEGDVQSLTTAFLDARYAPREIAPEQARGVQTVWRRLMRALRGPTGPGEA